jgi:hypothetical protein
MWDRRPRKLAVGKGGIMIMKLDRFCRVAVVATAVVLGLGAAGGSSALAAPSCDADAVAAIGAAIAEACPCEGRTNPAGEVVPWKNHGQYVSCVARERNRLARDLEVSKSCLRQAVKCGARSTCGKPGFVTCRTPDECSDTLPDGDPTGTCADDPTIACDTAADCPVLRCSTKSSEEACTSRGGIAGTGTCCD